MEGGRPEHKSCLRTIPSSNLHNYNVQMSYIYVESSRHFSGALMPPGEKRLVVPHYVDPNGICKRAVPDCALSPKGRSASLVGSQEYVAQLSEDLGQ